MYDVMYFYYCLETSTESETSYSIFGVGTKFYLNGLDT